MMYAEGQEEALLEAAVWAEAATLAEDVHKVAGPQPGDSAGRHAARGRTHRVAVPHGDRGNCRPVGRAAALAPLPTEVSTPVRPAAAPPGVALLLLVEFVMLPGRPESTPTVPPLAFER